MGDWLRVILHVVYFLKSEARLLGVFLWVAAAAAAAGCSGHSIVAGCTDRTVAAAAGDSSTYAPKNHATLETTSTQT